MFVCPPDEKLTLLGKALVEEARKPFFDRSHKGLNAIVDRLIREGLRGLLALGTNLILNSK